MDNTNYSGGKFFAHKLSIEMEIWIRRERMRYVTWKSTLKYTISKGKMGRHSFNIEMFLLRLALINRYTFPVWRSKITFASSWQRKTLMCIVKNAWTRNQVTAALCNMRMEKPFAWQGEGEWDRATEKDMRKLHWIQFLMLVPTIFSLDHLDPTLLRTDFTVVRNSICSALQFHFRRAFMITFIRYHIQNHQLSE